MTQVLKEEPLHPWLLERKIIHFDMDAFYASVEVRHRPELKGKPLIVGGSPQSRGVVCTASYEARKFGVRSAMACAQAARLCPEAIFISPDFAKYKAASQEIHEIFARYTSQIEPLSLDEAYLDVTHNTQGLYATSIALQIQRAIQSELRLSGSAGIAPNKLIAKIASDFHKPAGITVVLPEQVNRFMQKLPLRRLHGIGPATDKRLKELGLETCADVWKHSEAWLEEQLGSTGAWLYERSRGLDDRPVETSRERKSLGKEETFATDILERPALEREIALIAAEVAEALQRKGLRGRTITLKVKYADFSRCTRSQTLGFFTQDAEILRQCALKLLDATEAGQRKVRLLGVSVANFEGAGASEPQAAPSLPRQPALALL